ncbi:hypothetical protein HETIRDRAFT_49938, partial [Heterobasidion irregulare TC 32-1]
FESVLKDTVKGRRVSESKIKKLTEVALGCMENDTQLVSLLYRTHKALPASCKVSSLYAVDALARAARHRANKQGLTGDARSGHGDCATFLSKLEAVLEGVFYDMISSAGSEGKEKSQKIVDIWAKSNTFSPTVLTRLTDVLKDANKGAYHNSMSASENPTMSSSSPAASTLPVTGPAFPPINTPSTPPTVDPSIQSSLLALLTQAAN